MRSLLFVLLFGITLPSHANSAKLIGGQAFSSKVFSRFFEAEAKDKNWALVDLYFFTKPPESFMAQLGFYDKGSFEMKNGNPNSYNMILYSNLIDNIAQIVADSCSTLAIVKRPDLQKSLQSTVRQLCSWPLPSATDQNVLIDFFHQITLFDYSYEEKQAWLNHFQHPDMLKKTASEVIYEMTFTLMMNPYFLLNK